MAGTDPVGFDQPPQADSGPDPVVALSLTLAPLVGHGSHLVVKAEGSPTMVGLIVEAVAAATEDEYLR